MVRPIYDATQFSQKIIYFDTKFTEKFFYNKYYSKCWIWLPIWCLQVSMRFNKFRNTFFSFISFMAMISSSIFFSSSAILLGAER